MSYDRICYYISYYVPCSCRITALSTERTPTSPRIVVQWPRG